MKPEILKQLVTALAAQQAIDDLLIEELENAGQLRHGPTCVRLEELKEKRAVALDILATLAQD